MKKHVLKTVIFLLITILLQNCGTTKNSPEKQAYKRKITEKIDSLSFTIKAEEAHSVRFGTIHLTSDYDLKISKDTIKAFLPYFGRAFSTPLTPEEGGIKFTSTNFKYKIKKNPHKKNWTLSIEVIDTNKTIKLYIDIWSNGTTYITVSDPDKEPISFHGYIPYE